MTGIEWQEVSSARDAHGKEHKCKKCHKATTGTFNEVTQQCFKCHMEEM